MPFSRQYFILSIFSAFPAASILSSECAAKINSGRTEIKSKPPSRLCKGDGSNKVRKMKNNPANHPAAVPTKELTNTVTFQIPRFEATAGFD